MSKNNTPYIEEFEKEIKSNSYFANQHEGNEFVLKASRAIEIVAEHLTKTIERVCMDGYIDGHNDGRWISKKKLENEKEKYLKGFIKLGYGKRCKEYEEGCPTCDEWKLYDEYIK